jgi:hypothetical protein
VDNCAAGARVAAASSMGAIENLINAFNNFFLQKTEHVLKWIMGIGLYPGAVRCL